MLNIPDFEGLNPTSNQELINAIDDFRNEKDRTDKKRFILNILIPTIAGLIGVFLGIALTNKKDNTEKILEKQLQQLQVISKSLDSLNLRGYPKDQHKDTTMKQK